MGKARNLSELLDNNGDVRVEHLDNVDVSTELATKLDVN